MRQLLHATLGVFRELIKRGAAARARGLDPDTARAEIMPQIKDLMVQITGDARRRIARSKFSSSIGSCTGSTTS